MPDLRPDDQPPPSRRPLPVGPAVTALVLLALPIVALLLVPLYAKDEPELLGFPFFYWFQLLMVVVASALTYAAYVVVHRARRDRGGRR